MTIDNSDGALPIDYTEVTISRTMFRGGGSEYAINRTPCRLLDIQELLSDSGIGREMHVIVGQGQLDAVLRATPEERRGFIEEAAGVLKHRRRKEKALRKLEGMEGNLTRVADLTAEVRRQLGPLGRQAETARRAQSIQMTVRDARLRLLADDLVQQRDALEAELADERRHLARRADLEVRVAAAGAELAALEEEAAGCVPVLDQLQTQWYELTSLAQEFDATARLAGERARSLRATQHEVPAGGGRDPQQLRHQAERVRGEELELQTQVRTAQAALDAAVAGREAAEAAHLAEQQRLVRLARAAADRREGLAKLHGQLEARRTRVEAGEAEVERLRTSLDDARGRVAGAQNAVAGLVDDLRAREACEPELDAAADAARVDVERLDEQRQKLRDARNGAAGRRGAAQARAEALAETLGTAQAPADALPEDAAGLAGRFVSALQVEPGHEAAVSVALGWAAEAFVVDSHENAAHLLGALREAGTGRVDLVVVGDAPGGHQDRPDLPAGCLWVRDLVTAPKALVGALGILVDRLALAPDAERALAVVALGARAVTEGGDLFAPTYVRGGGAPGRSALEIRAALEAARAAQDAEAAREQETAAQLDAVSAPLQQAQGRYETALDALADNDAAIESLMEQLARHHQTMAGAGRERDRVLGSIEQARVALEANRGEVEELTLRLEQAQAEPDESEPSSDERDRLAVAAATARSTETEHRLTLRTREERARALAGRAESLEAAARSELAARERAAAKAGRSRAAAEVADAAQRAAAAGGEQARRALTHLTTLRDEQLTRRTERDAGIRACRSRVAELEQALRETTDSVHRDEVARARQRLHLEALEAKAREEHGLEPDALVEEYGPHRGVPSFEPGAEPDEPGAGHRVEAFDRNEQEKRLRQSEKDLARLGKVNPLALEEFAALEERHTFLTEQLADLRGSEKDLLSIVSEVDARVEQVFAEAFHDVAREFEGVFARLFPGGEGRLVLTDPQDMLTTGLDVEARPPGKKIKRLSLLSGGERSLVAVALLVSIFKARPSPFYIMDEVEAALDDANLGRLITLFAELRDSSQLIVITHQKRTMEVADALYGVTMRGDGVTTVVSQRLADVPRAATSP